MKNYVYTDGYRHTSEGLTADEINADESEHGELLYMKLPNGKSVRVDNRIDHPSVTKDDQIQLENFVNSNRESLVLEYNSMEQCRLRSMVLRKILVQNGCINRIQMHKRKSNLFFERIK